MKRLVVLFTALLLAGCSANDAKAVTEVAKEIDFNTVATEIANKMDVEKFSDMSKEDIASLLAVDEDIIKDAVYFNEDVKSLLVMETTDMEEAQTAVNYYLDTVKSTAEKYSPEDMAELENAVVMSVGNYIVMAIDSENANAVKLALNSLK